MSHQKNANDSSLRVMSHDSDSALEETFQFQTLEGGVISAVSLKFFEVLTSASADIIND